MNNHLLYIEEKDRMDTLNAIASPAQLQTHCLAAPMSLHLRLTRLAADLAWTLGILLRYPVRTTCTALVLLHRFFCTNSFDEASLSHVVLACLFLAGKLEETPRKMSDLANCYWYLVLLRRESPDTDGKADFLFSESVSTHPHISITAIRQKFYETKAVILAMEASVLTQLGFNVRVSQHPHVYLVRILESGQPSLLKDDGGGGGSFLQTAWGYINDSYRTRVCVKWQSPCIAFAAIILAWEKLPSQDSAGRTPWWSDPLLLQRHAPENTTTADLREIADEISRDAYIPVAPDYPHVMPMDLEEMDNYLKHGSIFPPDRRSEEEEEDRPSLPAAREQRDSEELCERGRRRDSRPSSRDAASLQRQGHVAHGDSSVKRRRRRESSRSRSYDRRKSRSRSYDRRKSRSRSYERRKSRSRSRGRRSRSRSHDRTSSRPRDRDQSHLRKKKRTKTKKKKSRRSRS
ncbi:MAG: hypothetical protein SGCHY_001154 [Lobulomycetales sp.]